MNNSLKRINEGYEPFIPPDWEEKESLAILSNIESVEESETAEEKKAVETLKNPEKKKKPSNYGSMDGKTKNNHSKTLLYYTIDANGNQFLQTIKEHKEDKITIVYHQKDILNFLILMGKITNEVRINQACLRCSLEGEEEFIFEPVELITNYLKGLDGDYFTFEDSSKTLARYYSPSIIQAVFNQLKEEMNFDKSYLESVKKDALNTPKANDIVRSVMNKSDIVYKESTGFYLYEDDLWVRKTDNFIDNLIVQELGRHSSGGLINSVEKVLKAQNDGTGINFNQKHIFQFKNGTLELDTLNFRTPDKSDYNTLRVNYDYTPEAECPRWNQFISEITGSETDKALLLQEIAGYCLFVDNRLQKIPFLKGEGSNGKNVFINTLIQLLGIQNVTTLAIDDLSQSFYRIRLKESYLNVFNEVENNKKIETNLLKRFAEGDYLTASEKYKPSETFKSRAKGVILGNNFPTSSDVSHGFYRRLLFVGFNEEFNEKPKGEHEHKVNINLEKELETELSGIFNWMLEGYKRLQKNNKFTDTAESEELKKEFAAHNDSVVDFMTNRFNDQQYKTDSQTEYPKYKTFCQETGRTPVSALKFSKRFFNYVRKNLDGWTAKRDKRRNIAINLNKIDQDPLGDPDFTPED